MTEEKVLGTILVYGSDALSEAAELIKPEMFTESKNRDLYELFLEMDAKDEHIETSTVFLKQKFELQYLMDLSNQIPSLSALGYHCRVMHEDYLRRILISKLDKLKSLAKSKNDTFDLIMEVQKEISDFDIQGESEKPMCDELDQIFDSVVQRLSDKVDDDVLTFRTLPSLNKIIGGIMSTDLIGIYGKEKSTKTTLAYEMLLDLAVDQKIPVGIFSLEMEKELVYWKAISMRTGLDLNKLRNPKGYDERSKLGWEEFKKVKDDVYKSFKDSRILINDEILDELQIQSKIKQWKKKYGVKIILIDYLMLINPSKNFKQLREEINYLSKFFKRLAKKLKVPIILISQANEEGSRAAEGKGLERDSNYFFYIEALEKGTKVEQFDPQTNEFYNYVALGDEYLVINRGLRHGIGKKTFLTRFVDNKYKELTVSPKYEF